MKEFFQNKKSIYVIVTVITMMVLIGITSYSYSAFFKEKTIEKSKLYETGSLSTIYEIQLEDGEEIEGKTRIERSNIRIQINEEEPYTLSEVEDKVIYKSGIGRNEEQEYSIRIWIDYKATKEISGQYFTGKIVLKGSTKAGEKPIEEDIELPPLKVFNGTTILNTNSIIKPIFKVKY